jgi:hypothetical protein
MDDQKLGMIGRILGVIQILVAIFVLDMKSWNQIIVSVLLFLGGTLMLTAEIDSTTIRRVRGVLSFVAVAISVALIIKILTVG